MHVYSRSRNFMASIFEKVINVSAALRKGLNPEISQLGWRIAKM